MDKKIILYIVAFSIVLLLISGCATVRSGKKQENERLKSRIAQLESEIELRDKRQKEIERLLEVETQKRRQMEDKITSAMSPSSRTDILSKAVTTPPTKRDTGSKSVSRVQLALKNAGFDPGKIDGKLGPLTKRAVVAFQKANGLVPDGIVGQKTWAKLEVYSKW